MTNIAQKLRALADEIEHEPKSAPAQRWPPKYVTLLVQSGDLWYLRVSAGSGAYYYPNGGRIPLDRWRYAPAPWDIAPEWATGWIVLSTGETLWARTSGIVLGASWMGRGTIAHVEYRLETEEAQR